MTANIRQNLSPAEMLDHIDDLNQSFAKANASDIIKWAFENYGSNLWIAFSGAEDVALLDLAVRALEHIDNIETINAFTLDTGRLHPETYEYLEEVRNYFGDSLYLEFLYPDNEKLHEFTAKKGLYSFYKDGHVECCNIRKVIPLKNKLATVDAWMTGVRSEQTGSRKTFQIISEDKLFSSEDHSIVKINPILPWSMEKAWSYISLHQLPYNKLHDLGYTSIGCEPCTRATLPHENPREGRWWYEEEGSKECGLHHHSNGNHPHKRR